MNTVLAKATGKILDGHIEAVLLEGVIVYARPCFAFPLFSIVSEKWLAKYKDKIMLVIAHLDGLSEKPLCIGVMPLREALLIEEGNVDKHLILTEKFRLLIDDQANIFTVDVLKEGKINLGKEATQPAVLGEQLASLMGKLIDEIAKLTVTTPVGPSGIPVNVAAFTALKKEFEKFQSKITFIK